MSYILRTVWDFHVFLTTISNTAVTCVILCAFFCQNKVDMSPVSGAACDDTLTTVSVASKRR